jgi:hypothetical protein
MSAMGHKRTHALQHDRDKQKDRPCGGLPEIRSGSLVTAATKLSSEKPILDVLICGNCSLSSYPHCMLWFCHFLSKFPVGKRRGSYNHPLDAPFPPRHIGRSYCSARRGYNQQTLA